MGVREGVNRLLKGVSRPLTIHEFNRGYVFVSMDIHLPEVLHVGNFDVDFNGTIVAKRRIDVSGRVHVSRKLLRTVDEAQTMNIKIVSKNRLEIKAENG